MLFDCLGSRQVVADFSGGYLSNDGGALLLRQIDRGMHISASLAACFRDDRDPRWVEHALPQLMAQRLIGMALGYEDLNDHNHLRRDPLLAVACEKSDPQGGQPAGCRGSRQSWGTSRCGRSCGRRMGTRPTGRWRR